MEQVCTSAVVDKRKTSRHSFILGKNKAADLKFVELAAREIADSVESGFKIVVEKSTVPVKAAESIATILTANKKAGVSYQVLSNPGARFTNV
jgi:UDPglucose 6-dehydrogenase